jgi:hypothetical protein
MPQFQDLTGKVFSRLTVLERAPNKGVRTYWLCKCECGRKKSIQAYSLSNGHTRSCGCIQSEFISIRNTTHGLCKTPEYNTWRKIKERCLNKDTPSFHNYGGRGISLFPEWVNSYEKFLSYIGNRPSKKHSIDRINNNGNYEPGNVRWATNWQQANNKRVNHIIEFNGITQTMAEWADQTGITYNSIRTRINKGWSIEDTLTISTGSMRHNSRILEYNGVSQSVIDWSRQTGLDNKTIYDRINSGWTIEDALTKTKKTGRILDYCGKSQSIADWSRETGIDGDIIGERVNKLGWTIEKALTVPVGFIKPVNKGKAKI